jgi:hypothetical protein
VVGHPGEVGGPLGAARALHDGFRELAQPRSHRVGRDDEVGRGERVQLVVGVESGRLTQRVAFTADVLQVVDVLEQPAVRAHRVAQRRREGATRSLVGQRERRVEQRHRLAVDHVPVARGGRAEGFEDLAVGDAAQRVAERESAGRRHRVGEVEGLGVERIGGPERDREPEHRVHRRRVPPER